MLVAVAAHARLVALFAGGVVTISRISDDGQFVILRRVALEATVGVTTLAFVGTTLVVPVDGTDALLTLRSATGWKPKEVRCGVIPSHACGSTSLLGLIAQQDIVLLNTKFAVVGRHTLAMTGDVVAVAFSSDGASLALIQNNTLKQFDVAMTPKRCLCAPVRVTLHCRADVYMSFYLGAGVWLPLHSSLMHITNKWAVGVRRANGIGQALWDGAAWRAPATFTAGTVLSDALTANGHVLVATANGVTCQVPHAAAPST